MTLETIDADGCIVMTGTAEVFRVFGAQGARIRAHDRMAVNTVFQTEWVTTQACYHGLIPLVIEKIHVITPHEIRVCDTLLTFSPGNFRREAAAGFIGRLQTGSQHQQEQCH
jgi:hypothetical protein